MENMSVPRQFLVRNFGVTWPHLDQNDSTSSDTGFFKGLQGGMDVGGRRGSSRNNNNKKNGHYFWFLQNRFLTINQTNNKNLKNSILAF